MTERDALIKKIAGRIDEYWDKSGAPILLSSLGNTEGGEVARQAREFAGSLANFIEREVPRARIVKHSRVLSLIGAVPKNVTEDSDDLLENVQRSSKNARFVEVLWNAFKNPLDADKRRFVRPRSADEPLHIVDIDRDDPPPDGSYEIPGNSIDQNRSISDTHSRIVAWIEENSCKVEDFIKKPATTQNAGGRDLLRCLLESLSEDDARRISLPLDIAQKLSQVLL